MYVDPTFGIGNREYLSDANKGAFCRNYGGANVKVYFNLVGGKAYAMKEGNSVSYRGHYKFYYRD